LCFDGWIAAALFLSAVGDHQDHPTPQHALQKRMGIGDRERPPAAAARAVETGKAHRSPDVVNGKIWVIARIIHRMQDLEERMVGQDVTARRAFP
jgi:hypothetical protein